MNKAALFAVSFLLSTTQAFAWGELVTSKVDGNYRYCYYTDGGALTTGPSNFCPSTNRGLAGQVDIQNSYGAGTLVEESVKGEFRYCKYSSGALDTIEVRDSCPPTNN